MRDSINKQADLDFKFIINGFVAKVIKECSGSVADIILLLKGSLPVISSLDSVNLSTPKKSSDLR